MLLKLGRYWIGFGSNILIQTKVPTTVRHFLFCWLFREARLNDLDRLPRFPPGTRWNTEGRSYRYFRAGAPPQVPPAPASVDAGSGQKPL